MDKQDLKHMKLIECISLLQKCGFTIFGSCVSDFILPCSYDCNSWRDFNEGVYYTDNISSIEAYGGDFEKLKCALNMITFKFYERMSIYSNVLASYRLEFDNCFDCEDRVEIDLIIYSENIKYSPMNTVVFVSIIGLDPMNNFIIYKETDRVKWCLKEYFEMSYFEFNDSCKLGIINRIAKKACDRKTVVYGLETFLTDERDCILHLIDREYNILFHREKQVISFPLGEMKEECPICKENTNLGIITLECKHKFHFGCLEKWSARDARCPMCRAEFATTNFACFQNLNLK